ncbi:hypothetical protein B0A48_07676 [Cryoendolithus antarcticus]|uniref:Uncharacterized protein n=1 Tax=Cryoendolithus antarcticus TaxID=1507870 RepID=A0A1V8T797_9PEZI|nr:hypothetical protein B0A48_07676 [Cryoendolithus antarcticus]
MDTSFPHVIREEFQYRDTLLVDVGGELKRHPRASTSELKPLLDGTATKDQVAHWYEAQLIHYGLQRSKDKNTAKLRLSQALSQKKLVVPSHIGDMEAQMRKEYASNVRRAKSAAAKAATTDESASIGSKAKSAKRKADDGDAAHPQKRTKITVKVDGVELEIDRSVDAAVEPAARAKAVKAVSKAQSTPKPKATRKSSALDKPTPASVSAFSATPASTTKQTLTTEKPSKVKKETKPKPEPKVKPEPKIKPGPKVKPEPSFSPPSPSVRNITGVYNISCPDLEDQAPECADTFRLFLCVEKTDNRPDLIWGSFDLAWKSGILRLDDQYYGPDQPLRFHWRARDSETGTVDFRRVCEGEIEFKGTAEVAGTFTNLFPETVEFSGRRRAGPLWSGQTARQYEEEWERIAREGYARR